MFADLYVIADAEHGNVVGNIYFRGAACGKDVSRPVVERAQNSCGFRDGAEPICEISALEYFCGDSFFRRFRNKHPFPFFRPEGGFARRDECVRHQFPYRVEMVQGGGNDAFYVVAEANVPLWAPGWRAFVDFPELDHRRISAVSRVPMKIPS